MILKIFNTEELIKKMGNNSVLMLTQCISEDEFIPRRNRYLQN